MENAIERAESGSERKGTPGPFPEAFLALLPVLACFLGGATQKWGEGIVVALLGIYLLARPPRFSLGLPSNLVLLALVLLAGTAFLPANWFYQPNWRATYINDFGIALPNTLSLQPWITGTSFISFLAGLTAIIILACGQDDIRKGRKRWIVWGAALALMVAAIILNFSRAGIGILVAGSALWLGVFSLRQRSPSRIALVVSFLLLLLTALLLFGGQTLERFHLRNLADVGISNDFRWRIFSDVFQLIRDSPWVGIGLGNFEDVFAIFRAASYSDRRAIHPESDWLWLWTELGWLAVVLVMVGLILLVRKIYPLREGTNQRYRLASLIAAILFALHGLVDVSGHRVGTSLAAMFLLGLSLHRPHSFKPSRSVSILFRLIGLILLVLGSSWVVAAEGQKLLPGSVGVTNAKQLATIDNRERNFAETIAVTTTGLKWAPLDWELYFSRAVAEAELKQTDNALTDFRRARFLEPISYELPLAEGNIWLSSQPVLAATAWREALRRAGPERAGVFASMLSKASLRSTEVSRILAELGVSSHDLALPYLARISGADFNRALAKILENDPELSSFSETEKLALFAYWSERGDAAELSRATAQHPDWLPYA